MQSNRLGQWAIIDIETTGAMPTDDQIIDVGYLAFDGLKLKKKYSSLVKCDRPLSEFIKKLTGINDKMLRNAPEYREVENHIQELSGHTLIAHNSDFEESFLRKSLDDGIYADSLLFLALLFPDNLNLKLDTFIRDFKIRDAEEHRGLSDAIDLLKVILVAVLIFKKDKDYAKFITGELIKLSLNEKDRGFFLAQFLYLSEDEIIEIGRQIDFNPKENAENFWHQIYSERVLGLKKKDDVGENDHQYISPSIDFTGENIQKIFRDEANLKHIFKDYQVRESQVSMALKTGQSLKNEKHTFIQAPTGTGKTVGYLIPAALQVLSEKKPVLIATGTKTLQEQAQRKDVPTIKKILGKEALSLNIITLVGSSNHWCEAMLNWQNLKAAEDQGFLNISDSEFERSYTRLFFSAIFYLNKRNEQDKKMLRADFPYVLKKKIPLMSEWDEEIAVNFKACTSSRCPYRDDCSYLQGLKEARDADIIIGNHSLMFTWPQSIPRPLHIIVDEAHRLEDEATKAFSREFSELQLKKIGHELNQGSSLGSLFFLMSKTGGYTPEQLAETIKILRNEFLQSASMINDHLEPLSLKWELYFKKLPKFSELYSNEIPMISRTTHGDQSAIAILNHLESLSFILMNLVKFIDPYWQKYDIKNLKSDEEVLSYTRFETFYSEISDLSSVLLAALASNEVDCVSMKFKTGDGGSLTLTPVDIGMIIKEKLLDTSTSVVFTSATLANESGDTGSNGASWAQGLLYTSAEKRFRNGLFLPATFDYKNHTKIYLSSDGPPLYSNEFVKFHVEKIIPLINKLGGRTLILFSAKARFEAAREILLKEFADRIPVFIQGMGPNVVEEFKMAPQGILLGMESFSEGIDIPGKALQFVFIDKIPDLRQDLVIERRRDFFEKRFGNEFVDYYLAHRTRSLHQKLGRLLRTENDFGGALIVDSRIKSWKPQTIEKFLKLMEPYQIHLSSIDESLVAIQEFILNPPEHLL